MNHPIKKNFVINYFNLYKSIVYANHHSDSIHVEMFGKAVVVNPTAALKKIAAERSWEIQFWINKSFKNNPSNIPEISPAIQSGNSFIIILLNCFKKSHVDGFFFINESRADCFFAFKSMIPTMSH